MEQPFPPGPPRRKGGLLGNLRYGWSMLRDPIGFVGGRFEAYGDIYCAPNPDGYLYLLRHPDHVAEVLRTRAVDFGKTHSALLRLADVRDHLLTFFLAGHETTSHALTWTFYLLSQNPEVAGALHAELVGHLGDRTPTVDDLDALPMTERVVKESMRLYPPAYAVARRAERDTRVGGWPIPEGSEVVTWIYFTHRDPRWYPDPDRFDPSRFEPEAEEARPPTSYLPFGAGQRMCIGHRFAMVEAQLVLAVFARAFHFRLAHGQRVDVRPRVTLTPRWGMRVAVTRR